MLSHPWLLVKTIFWLVVIYAVVFAVVGEPVGAVIVTVMIVVIGVWMALQGRGGA